MTDKKLKIQMNGRSDEFYTPKIAIKSLLPFLKKEWIILENAWGKGHLAKHFEEEGFKVVKEGECDIIITNPPYSKKEEWLKECYKRNKPFALLMPLTTLEGKRRGELFRKYGIELIIPNKRINFITPSGKGSGAWFQVGWFCWKLNLPNQLNFVEVGE